ncbi:hypothetical protein Y032_0007g3210 [Ancylostoma ceylanicum]|uniref:Uncharacterized protein n=1 Tax=Ancylostoma ceylanicum TaxID=53326 RepID=A0A016VM69_9BILA|nr:hypothetical protein Y032_0007g3210 [Ancylostoma ceylanicum]
MILAGLRAIRFLKIFYRNGYSDRSSWANTIEKRTLLYGRVDGLPCNFGETNDVRSRISCTAELKNCGSFRVWTHHLLQSSYEILKILAFVEKGMAYEIAFKEGLPYDCTCPVCDQSELHESIGNVSCLFFIVLLH